MKELKEFPDYFISEDGKVYSKKRNTLKQLTPSRGYKGYLGVMLYINEKRYYKKIHRLVAETYIKNPNGLPQVNHIDEDKSNNHISNLEWVTCSQNIIHSKCRWIWEIENIITGQIIKSTNLSEFTRNNNLDISSLYRTYTGKSKQHKNFKIKNKTQFK